MPSRLSSQSSSAHRAPSISRRASLANMLQRMSSAADSERMREIVQDCQDALDCPTATASKQVVCQDGASVASDSSLMQKSHVQAGEGKRARILDNAPLHSDSRLSKADANRLQSDPCCNSMPDSLVTGKGDIGSKSVHPEQVTHSTQGGNSAAAVKESGMSQSLVVHPGLKRSISTDALAALDSVESLKCPIMEFSLLELKRKIGDGAIGQVLPCCCTSSTCFRLHVNLLAHVSASTSFRFHC